MLHIAIDNADHRSSGSECAFDECPAQPTAPDPLDTTNSAIALGNLTNPIASSIRTVIVNNNYLVGVTFQGGLDDGNQRANVIDLVERRYHDSKFKICGELSIVTCA